MAEPSKYKGIKLSNWNFRIVEQEYDDGSKKYILESDKGTDEWSSLFRSEDLNEVRRIKQEREAKMVPKVTRIIE